jgi:hypothetical protein
LDQSPIVEIRFFLYLPDQEPFAKVFSLRSLRLCGEQKEKIHRRDAEDAEKKI